MAAGDRRLPVVETPWGSISVAICHDLDFADLVAQAGRARIDVVFGPSADWAEVAGFHARMARLRAIENGLVLARPAQGISFVTDAYGRVTGLLGSTWTDPATLLSDVPLGRAPVLYPWIGELSGWVSAALTLAPVGAGRKGKRVSPQSL